MFQTSIGIGVVLHLVIFLLYLRLGTQDFPQPMFRSTFSWWTMNDFWHTLLQNLCGRPCPLVVYFIQQTPNNGIERDKICMTTRLHVPQKVILPSSETIDAVEKCLVQQNYDISVSPTSPCHRRGQHKNRRADAQLFVKFLLHRSRLGKSKLNRG